MGVVGVAVGLSLIVVCAMVNAFVGAVVVGVVAADTGVVDENIKLLGVVVVVVLVLEDNVNVCKVGVVVVVVDKFVFVVKLVAFTFGVPFDCAKQNCIPPPVEAYIYIYKYKNRKIYMYGNKINI